MLFTFSQHLILSYWVVNEPLAKKDQQHRSCICQGYVNEIEKTKSPHPVCISSGATGEIEGGGLVPPLFQKVGP